MPHCNFIRRFTARSSVMVNMLSVESRCLMTPFFRLVDLAFLVLPKMNENSADSNVLKAQETYGRKACARWMWHHVVRLQKTGAAASIAIRIPSTSTSPILIFLPLNLLPVNRIYICSPLPPFISISSLTWAAYKALCPLIKSWLVLQSQQLSPWLSTMRNHPRRPLETPTLPQARRNLGRERGKG